MSKTSGDDKMSNVFENAPLSKQTITRRDKEIGSQIKRKRYVIAGSVYFSLH